MATSVSKENTKVKSKGFDVLFKSADHQQNDQVTKQIFNLSGNDDKLLDEKLSKSRSASSSGNSEKSGRAMGMVVDNPVDKSNDDALSIGERISKIENIKHREEKKAKDDFGIHRSGTATFGNEEEEDDFRATLMPEALPSLTEPSTNTAAKYKGKHKQGHHGLEENKYGGGSEDSDEREVILRAVVSKKSTTIFKLFNKREVILFNDGTLAYKFKKKPNEIKNQIRA